jgi:cytoskeletal protein RodZ
MVDDEPIAAIDSVGQRLRAAREAKGLTIEDVASSTRIPTRHLLSLEESDWGKLPASTYSVGFAKNYAGAVGLDRAEIAEQLRAEMGSELPAHYSTATVDSFEPVDGNRSMPKGIVVGALVALVAIALLLTWLSNRELSGDDAVAEPAAETVAAVPAVTPAAQGPVVITANDAVWIQVRDGATVLKQGELAAGSELRSPGERDCAGADHRQARGAAHLGRDRRCAADRPGGRADLQRQPARPRPAARPGCGAGGGAHRHRARTHVPPHHRSPAHGSRAGRTRSCRAATGTRGYQ